jgi:hypothetical protein
MKKILVFLTVVLLSASVYAQQGDLSFGAKGSYLTDYKNIIYGLDLSYHLTDPLEISLSQMINPSIIKKEDYMRDQKLGLYSTNLDFRYYLIYQRYWGSGPIIGGQYLYVKDKENEIYNINSFGVNIGWHLRVNINDNLRVSGSWKYSSGQDETSYNAYSLGLCYTLNIF